MSYKDNEDVAMYMVYLREIHPTADTAGEGDAGPRPDGPQIDQHTSFVERVAAASDCLKGLELTIPTLIDDMEDTALRAFSVHAACTVVIDLDGKVAFYSTGPNGVQPDNADKTIRKLVGIEEASDAASAAGEE